MLMVFGDKRSKGQKRALIIRVDADTDGLFPVLFEVLHDVCDLIVDTDGRSTQTLGPNRERRSEKREKLSKTRLKRSRPTGKHDQGWRKLDKIGGNPQCSYHKIDYYGSGIWPRA